MTDETQTSGRRIPRWLYYTFIASVAANLLVAGGIAAAVWHHRHGPGLMGFVHSLPADRQTAVREQIEAARVSLKPLRQSMHEAWRGVNAAMAAEPFDKPALKAAMQKLGEADQKLKSAIGDQIADTAEKLSPAERRQMQDWIGKRGWHLFGRHRPKDGDGPPGPDPAADGPGEP